MLPENAAITSAIRSSSDSLLSAASLTLRDTRAWSSAFASRHPAHRAEHVEAGFGTLLEQLQHVLAIEDVERARLGGGRGRGARATVEQ
jgi:hypothetical protein